MGSLRGEVSESDPQEAEPALSPLPTSLHWRSENSQSFKPIGLFVAFWGAASCLVMKFHSLIVCLSVEDKAIRARGRASFNSTKTQNSTQISTQDPDHQASFFIGGVGGTVPISQVNLLRHRKMEQLVFEQPPGTAEPRSGLSSTALQCLSYPMPPG